MVAACAGLPKIGNWGHHPAVSLPNFPEISRAISLKNSEDTVDPTLRDPLENGMESTRARFTRRRRTFHINIDLLSEQDKYILDEFLTQTVVYGALPFLFTDPRKLVSPETYTVRFATLIKYSDAGYIGADSLGTPAGYRYNCQFDIREV
jgi:hypothetical protein